MPVLIRSRGSFVNSATFPIVYAPLDYSKLLGHWRLGGGDSSLAGLVGGTLTKEGSPTWQPDGIQTDWTNRLATQITDRPTCTIVTVARPVSTGAPYRVQAVTSLSSTVTVNGGRVAYRLADTLAQVSTRARDTAGGLIAVDSAAIPIAETATHQFSAHVFDAAAGKQRLYAPHWSPNMAEGSVAMTAGAGTIFRIGSPFSGTAPSQSTEGVIGEVQIWDVPLNLLQLQQVYADAQTYWATKGISI